MSTTINEATRARLVWMAEQLTKLHEYNYVRYEGDTIFRAVRQELDDINANAVEPVYQPPATVLQVVEVSALGAITTSIIEAVESSDLAVIDAIAQTRADVLAAIPAPAPAEAAQ